MTTNEMRIAIAEACGWKWINKTTMTYGAETPEKEWNPPIIAPDSDSLHWEGISPALLRNEEMKPIPDYPNDLNAMHAAVQNLSPSQRGYFNAELFKLASGRNLSSAVKEPDFIFATINATARQRAKAFLITIGKWEEATK